MIILTERVTWMKNAADGRFQDGIVTKGIIKLSDSIINVTEKIESIKGHTPERIALVLYFIGHMLMLLVHEPWFDEALAWLIARDSSLYEIIFVAPHYEGHPSLWHLILLPFAKLGASYELTLSIVSLVFSGIAMAIFIYKAPVKRIIRLFLPFTYYLFYQYSVISRPYCMMMLAFILIAVTYKNRDEKPGRYVLSLWFLCMTSAYGIVIAGGICIVWLINMFMDARKQSNNKNSENGEYRGTLKIFIWDKLLKHGKILWLFLLLVYVLFIIWRIMPAEDAYAVLRTNVESRNGIIVRLLYAFFGIISDVFFTNVYDLGVLQEVAFSAVEMVAAVLIGFVLIYVLLFFAKKTGHLFDVLIPLGFFCVFSSIVYFYDHHIGIVLLLIIYWTWIISDSSKENSKPMGVRLIEKPIYKGMIRILMCVMIVIPIYWSVGSCICDIFYEYGYGRNEYEFLKDNNLEESSILAEWADVSMYTEGHADLSKWDYMMSKTGMSAAPYLDGSNMMNTPEKFGMTYTYSHKLFDETESNTQLEILKHEGTPEVLLGMPELTLLYMDRSINLGDYTKVYQARFSVIKKAIPGREVSYVYVRNDIAEEKGLKEISNQ